MLDVEAGRPVWKVQDSELTEYLCGAMHPDGNFFACGGTTGGLRLFDVRSSPLMTINSESGGSGSTGVVGSVRSVSFNENGYWAALACDEGVQVSCACAI
jgi:WD40 repeat protein